MKIDWNGCGLPPANAEIETSLRCKVENFDFSFASNDAQVTRHFFFLSCKRKKSWRRSRLCMFQRKLWSALPSYIIIIFAFTLNCRKNAIILESAKENGDANALLILAFSHHSLSLSRLPVFAHTWNFQILICVNRFRVASIFFSFCFRPIRGHVHKKWLLIRIELYTTFYVFFWKRKSREPTRDFSTLACVLSGAHIN